MLRTCGNERPGRVRKMLGAAAAAVVPQLFVGAGALASYVGPTPSWYATPSYSKSTSLEFYINWQTSDSSGTQIWDPYYWQIDPWWQPLQENYYFWYKMHVYIGVDSTTGPWTEYEGGTTYASLGDFSGPIIDSHFQAYGHLYEFYLQAEDGDGNLSATSNVEGCYVPS